ncbi:MAG: Holliday junction resolvase RuvX [Alphaproteobacteria bacterium]|nr:Holliday junction resolvase RuvX [Alphaproteobacteria bacterium]
MGNDTDAPTPSGTIFEDADAFAGSLIDGAPLLGIDPGTKTLGLSISDTTLMIASPLETIRRKKFSQDIVRLKELLKENGVCGLVVGLPRNLDGSEGPRAQSTRALARNLVRETQLPILLWDERLTTSQAERMLIDADASRKRRGEVIDKLAATLILQGVLDRLRN